MDSICTILGIFILRAGIWSLDRHRGFLINLKATWTNRRKNRWGGFTPSVEFVAVTLPPSPLERLEEANCRAVISQSGLKRVQKVSRIRDLRVARASSFHFPVTFVLLFKERIERSRTKSRKVTFLIEDSLEMVCFFQSWIEEGFLTRWGRSKFNMELDIPDRF